MKIFLIIFCLLVLSGCKQNYNNDIDKDVNAERWIECLQILHSK